jgi:hypothetical protein
MSAEQKFCTSCYSPRAVEGGRMRRRADGKTRFVCMLCLGAIKGGNNDHAWLKRTETRSHRHSPGV